MEKLKKFFTEDKIGMQIYSFIKTYVIVFLGIYLYGIENQDKDIFDTALIISSAKFSLLSIIRNIWKLLTE
jgi:hypothetical protein